MKPKILVVLFCFVLISCNKDSNPTDNIEVPQTTLKFPLKLGNTWNYKVSTYDSLGNQLSTTTVTNIITADTTISNNKWYHIDNCVFNFYWTANLTEGYALAELSQSGLDGPFYLFKTPVKVGDSYSHGTGKFVYVTTIDSTITFNSIQQKCYVYKRYESLGPNFPGRDYVVSFSTGIILFRGYRYKANGQQYIAKKIELQSYTLN